MIDDIFYHGFILAESRVSTFQFEKYDLAKMSFGESVEDDIVASLSYEYHIFRCVGEVGKCGEDFLIELSEDLIARSFEDGFF
jgi:hypothetical protein